MATLDAALAKQGQTLEAVERWKAEMPTEAEMLPKDKYTFFDRKAKRYRKGIHSKSPRHGTHDMALAIGGCGWQRPQLAVMLAVASIGIVIVESIE